MSRDAILRRVVSNLSEEMKGVYQQATAGNPEAQNKIGKHLFNSGDADTWLWELEL